MIDYDNFDEVFERFCEISGDLHACDCRHCEFEYSDNCKDIKNKDHMVEYIKDFEKEFEL